MHSIRDLVLARDVEGLRAAVQTSSDAKALVNEVDKWGATPLLTALEQTAPDREVVRVLLEAGADPLFVKVDRPFDFAKEAGLDLNETLASIGIKLPKLDFGIGETFSTYVLTKAMNSGDLEIVKAMAENGADLRYTTDKGYTALIDAIYAPGDPVEVVDYLIGLGIDPNAETQYGEKAIVVALRQGKWKCLASLLEVTKDETALEWTPLIKAVVVGGYEDVVAALDQGTELEARDVVGRTALQEALYKGDVRVCDLLLERGANWKDKGKKEVSTMSLAIGSGNVELVRRLLDLGSPANEQDEFGNSPLAAACLEGHLEIVQLLLERGADPNKGDHFDSYLSNAKDRPTILALLAAGADPSELDHEGRRRLVGLGEVDESQLATVSRDHYFEFRFEREGKANPEDVTDPFRLAMIRSGCNAYRPRDRFEDDPTFACNRSWKDRPPQVWCFDRFGQSFTLMPDGRTIMIAGEHEDSYDPDFCIYNDVTVFHADGSIQVLGYPYKVFEPTDFHTATLVGDKVWIIGGLGYTDQRKGPIPVYRLDTLSYSIERVATSGDVPPRIHRHRAQLVGGAIVVRGGEAITFNWGKESHDANTSVYKLDLQTLVWNRMHG